jgi:hypothetical protein
MPVKFDCRKSMLKIMNVKSMIVLKFLYENRKNVWLVYVWLLFMSVNDCLLMY